MPNKPCTDVSSSTTLGVLTHLAHMRGTTAAATQLEQQHSTLCKPQSGRQAGSGHVGSRLRMHFMSLAAPILEPGSHLSGRAQASLALLWSAGAQSTSQEQDQGMSEQLSSTWQQLLAASYAEPTQRVKAAALSKADHEAQEEQQREAQVDPGERGGGWEEGEGDEDQLEEQDDPEG